jgi:glutathione synthase/RimK-type ligase-like ATP-grasp enzyme
MLASQTSTPTTTPISAPEPVVITDDLGGSGGLVVDKLRERGWQGPIIECSKLADQGYGLVLQSEGRNCRAVIRTPVTEVHIGPDTRVLRRQPDMPRQHADDPDSAAIAKFVNGQIRGAMQVLFSLQAIWMNAARADMRLDQNKLYGAIVADRMGFTTIPTALTDSPDDWRRLVQLYGRRGDLAVKPVASWAATVDGEDAAIGTYTTRLSVEDALALADTVCLAPVLLQPYIEKKHELRVTVVGDEVFSCKIDSQASDRTATDWRHYDFDRTPHEAVDLGSTVTSKLRQFMQATGLVYAAFDFIVCPNGHLIFVEVNPAGQFGWIEALTGLPISDAIASWLLDSAPT